MKPVFFTRLLLITLLGTLLALEGNTQAPTHTGRFSPAIDGNINGFWEYLPRNYPQETDRTYPLLIFIHAGGEMGSTPDMATLSLVLKWGPPRLINEGRFPDSFFVNNKWSKFIVLSPQIKNGLGGSGSIIDPSLIKNVIDYAKSTYRVDPFRIYLCGSSMGGGATWDFAGSNNPNASGLAAVVAVSGAGDLSNGEANVISNNSLPVLAVHNTVDNVVPVSRTQNNIAAINNRNPAVPPRAIYFNSAGPGGDPHNAWSRTFEEITPGSTVGGNVADSLGTSVYEWFLRYQRGSAGALPVTWKNVSATLRNNAVYLQWDIENQVNVSSYTIQRSTDGVQWVDLTTLSAQQAGGGTELHYAYTDGQPNNPINFYRIRENDVDNRFAFSKVLTINIARDRDAISVYPNPFAGQVKVVLPGNGNTGEYVTMRMTNPAGVTVHQQRVIYNDFSTPLTFSGLERLTRGAYFMTVEDDKGVVLYRKNLVKE